MKFLKRLSRRDYVGPWFSWIDIESKNDLMP